MHTSAKCLGLLTMPLQINFNGFTFGVSADGDQAKQLSTDSLRQSHGRPQRYRSFIARPQEINTGSQKDVQGREGAALGRVPQLSGGGKTLSGFIWVQCVSCSVQLQIETSEQEREKKSNEKNFLKEVE